jgi:streptomycin 6-kinase
MPMPELNRHVAGLPAEFLQHNSPDPGWLQGLPDLLARLAARWSLTLAAPFPALRINYVAPATRADGTPCVLKVSRHVEETRSEIAALQLWDGAGAARLLEADSEIGALLVEQLRPGTMLLAVADDDDDRATVIAADVLRELWRPAPPDHGLRTLESWCTAYERNRAALSQGAGGFPAALFLRADALRAELLASAPTPVVLHGDLHHYNILRAQRAEWLAIDPKGLLGDPCFDICQYLRNPYPGPIEPGLNRRRLDRFCTELGLDRERTKAWCFVHAMLDACWSFEDGESWARTVAYAEATLAF